MGINWKVYTKASESSPWKFTGIIESNKSAAEKRWPNIIKNLGYHSFKLEWTQGGIPINWS
jgi:hypothetical protein